MIKKPKKLTVASIVSRPRKEAFSKRDSAFLKKNPPIKVGEFLGEGCCGQIFTVACNDKMVVKVPHGAVKKSAYNPSYNGVTYEAELHEKECFNKEPLLIPTKTVYNVDYGNGDYGIGMVRPRITPIVSRGRRHIQLTDSQIMDLRKKIIHLSRRNLALQDGVQVGIDETGRLLIFDTGCIFKTAMSANAFHTNNGYWKMFLRDLGKTDSQIARYGAISQWDD